MKPALNTFCPCENGWVLASQIKAKKQRQCVTLAELKYGESMYKHSLPNKNDQTIGNHMSYKKVIIKEFGGPEAIEVLEQ